MEGEFVLVKMDVLSEVVLKVIEVKRLLFAGEVESVNAAVRQVGISRSAYYKYRDSVRIVEELRHNLLYHFSVTCEQAHLPLTRIINAVRLVGTQIHTLHQNVPIRGLTTIDITVAVGSAAWTPDELTIQLKKIPGIHRLSMPVLV